MMRISLITKGSSTKEAQEASEALNEYLITNKIELTNLIQQELKKIHPSLEALDLKEVISACQEVKLGHSQQKGKLLENLSIFGENFKKHMKSFLSILPFIFMISCGVKQDPSPMTEAVRPDIPFGKKQILKPKTKESVKQQN